MSHIPAGRNGTILDIGGTVGNLSLAFSRAFKAVHSFEPNPLCWTQFEKNMLLNGLNNVHLRKVGLTDQDTELILHMIDRPNLGFGTFSTVEQYDLPLKAVATCTIHHAASYLTKIGVKKVDAIKIDVQGFEPEVLRGLGDVLDRDRPVIWCEIGAGTKANMRSFNNLADLIPFEFLCYKFRSKPSWRGNTLTLIDSSGPMDQADYLMVPK